MKMLIEKAIAIEMERGRPSGTATIITAQQILKMFISCINVILSKSDYGVIMTLIPKYAVIVTKRINPTV